MSDDTAQKKVDSPVAGTSGEGRSKRPRRLYSSSDDDSDVVDLYPPSSPKRVCTRDEYSDQRLDFLQKQVSELKYLITRSCQDTPKPASEGGLFDREDDASVSSFLVKPDAGFDWDDDTTVSETVKRTAESRLNYVRKVQHFDSTEWNNVRYTDVQKKHLSSPAFTNLTLNDELLAFEAKFSQLRSLDQTFGALSNMLITQKEALQTTLKELLAWSADSNTQLTKTTLSSKVHELFSNTCPYMAVSKDILQTVCGRRANVIEHRRDSVLSAVKDKYDKTILRKIPPSCEYLFQPKEFSDTLARLGGGSKVFHKNYLPAEGRQSAQTNRRPYMPAEGDQAAPRRYTNPAVPFRGYNPNKYQQAPASGKGKSHAGKQPYSAAKNKSYRKSKEDRDRRDDRKQ